MSNRARAKRGSVDVGKRRQLPKELRNISEEKLKEYTECFEMFDQNGDGVITSEEMVRAMRGLGHNPTKREVAEMLGLDPKKDGNGEIAFPAFCKILHDWPEEKDTPECLIEAFQVFDKDNDGFITAEELRQAMANLGDKLSDEEVTKMIKQADRNGDGKIDISEFSTLLTL